MARRSTSDVARERGTAAHLIDDEHAIEEAWLADVEVIGLSGGASAPESCVRDVLAWLAALGYDEVRTVKAAEENQQFALPGS